MPYPNFHSCRLNSPDKYSKFRYKKQSGADVVLGMKSGGEWEVQAIRYPKESFGEAQARASCGKHGGSFEAASGSKDHSDAEFWMGMAIQEWPDDEELPKCFHELDGEGHAGNKDVHDYAQALKGIEIFSVGKWNNDEYSAADLDSMVSAFYSKATPRAPALKLGHDDTQKWFGQKDGAPSLGWLERLYRSGEKLLGDFIDVPDVVVKLINAKRYRTKSAEIYWDYKDKNGRTWPRVLKDLALQGADMPAVGNLQDLQMALMSDGSRDLRTYGDESLIKVYSDDKFSGGKKRMESKVYEEAIASYKSQLEQANKDKAEWEERAIKAETKLAKKDEDLAIKEFREVTIPKLKEEGKILPAEEDSLVIAFSAISTSMKKYGDREVNPREEFVKGLQSRKPQVSFKDTGSGGDDDDDRSKDPAVAVHEKIEQFMKEEKAKTYQEGKELVKSRHPELWKRYIGR